MQLKIRRREIFSHWLWQNIMDDAVWYNSRVWKLKDSNLKQKIDNIGFDGLCQLLESNNGTSLAFIPR